MTAHDEVKCEKYYAAMMKNPVLDVTPAQAFSHMLATVVYEPITLSGKVIGSFINHATGKITKFSLLYRFVDS